MKFLIKGMIWETDTMGAIANQALWSGVSMDTCLPVLSSCNGRRGDKRNLAIRS